MAFSVGERALVSIDSTPPSLFVVIPAGYYLIALICSLMSSKNSFE
jgi:hypothetical protein